ncbi:MAG: hypothetical protein JNK10_09395 [Cyclobacteriaceae bacterium]|nr:hypothetical protein [Cyclobacteriaceae bacterium]
MKSNPLPTLLSAASLCIVLFVAANSSDGHFNKVTVREFELVDGTNTSRVSIKVEDTGEVVFRLRDQKGAIRVKLDGHTDGSGLVLLDQDTNPGVHMLSGTNGVKLTLTGPDGNKRVY